MAASTKLNAQARDQSGKGSNRKLRQEGRIPAVLYGHGEQTRSISLDAHEVENVFKTISVENTIINLQIDGDREKAAVRALVREVQTHPFRSEITHVDFYQIHAGERVHVEVPIHLVGTAAGVREGGLLQQSLDSLGIRCAAEQIPQAIEVDVSALTFGDSLHVRDLTVPEGVTLETDPDTTVCSLLAPQVAVVEPTAEVALEPAATEPEVIRRRPAAEEG